MNALDYYLLTVFPQSVTHAMHRSSNQDDIIATSLTGAISLFIKNLEAVKTFRCKERVKRLVFIPFKF